MRYSNGQLIYSDIRNFNITVNQNQSIILKDQLSENEAIAGLQLVSDNDCKIKFVWNDKYKNEEKQYPKQLNANQTYFYENLDLIKDVICVECEPNTNFTVALGV